MNALLAVFTILGGIAALLYFNEKLRLRTWATVRSFLVRTPRTPLTASSIGAYVNTHRRPRSLDKAIADDFGAAVARSDKENGVSP